MTRRPTERDIRTAYDHWAATGGVARFYERFRAGGVVSMPLPPPPPLLADYGEVVCNATAHVANLQLRTLPERHPGQPATRYGVFATLDDGRGWTKVDGPWKIGEGPFDRKR